MTNNFLHKILERLKNAFGSSQSAVDTSQLPNTGDTTKQENSIPVDTLKPKPGNLSTQWTEQDITDFALKLNQVIGWTQKLAQDFDYKDGFYGTVFRQTNPVIDGTALYHLDGDYATWQHEHSNKDMYPVLLKKAIEVRNNHNEISISSLMEQGSILIVEIGLSTRDGAATVGSQCFVDESDVPPIDTWFYISKSYYKHGSERYDALFCWIPTAFIPVMEQAIKVEIMDSYEWLHKANPGLYQKIQVQFAKMTSNRSDNTFTILWQNKNIGAFKLTGTDMWYWDGEWQSNGTTEAELFKKIASGLDIKKAMNDATKGERVILISTQDTSSKTYCLSILLEGTTLSVRILGSKEATDMHKTMIQ